MFIDFQNKKDRIKRNKKTYKLLNKFISYLKAPSSFKMTMF